MTLREKILAVMNDVALHITERAELIQLIAIALLTRKNLFVLGEPGQAKSYAINLFRDRIEGATQFERLMSKQSDEEQLFGRIDLQSLIPGSVAQDVLNRDPAYSNMLSSLEGFHQTLQQNPSDQNTMDSAKACATQMEDYRKVLSSLHQGDPRLITTGKIPEAHIVFLDEIFKCNDGVLNSLLTALNERKYTNEGRTYPIPTISFFAASNEIPNFNDPSEKILEALYDRLELKLVTENIEDRTNRLAMMTTKQQGHTMMIDATITLDELYAMQQEVAQVAVPDAMNELADDIFCELRRSGLKVSDRKLLNYAPIAQAMAWLSGRNTVSSMDLLALKWYLWQKPTDRQLVDATLERLCINPLQDKVHTIRGMADEIRLEFEGACANASGSQGGELRKQMTRPLQKFRGEIVRLYRQQVELSAAAQTEAERAMVKELLEDMEKLSKRSHEMAGFTYAALDQLELMNN